MKRGDLYRSTVWLNPDRSGETLIMEITRVAAGTIYYRPVYGLHDDGTRWYGSAARFVATDAARWLGEKVDATVLKGGA